MLGCIFLLLACSNVEDINPNSHVRFEWEGQEFELDSVRATAYNFSLFGKRRVLSISGKAGNRELELAFTDRDPVEDVRCIAEGEYKVSITLSDPNTSFYYHTSQGTGEITSCTEGGGSSTKAIFGTFSGTLKDTALNSLTISNGEIRNLYFY